MNWIEETVEVQWRVCLAHIPDGEEVYGKGYMLPYYITRLSDCIPVKEATLKKGLQSQIVGGPLTFKKEMLRYYRYQEPINGILVMAGRSAWFVSRLSEIYDMECLTTLIVKNYGIEVSREVLETLISKPPVCEEHGLKYYSDEQDRKLCCTECERQVLKDH